MSFSSALLNAAQTADDLRIPPAIGWKSAAVTGLDSGVFASTVNGGFASLAYKPMTTALAHTRSIGMIAHIDAGKTTALNACSSIRGTRTTLGEVMKGRR